MTRIDPSIPSRVVREQLTRWHAELAEDAERVIKGPIADQGYDIDALEVRLGDALRRESHRRGEQGALKAATGTATGRVSERTEEATRYIHDVALRAEMLVHRDIAEGTTLLAIAESRYLPPDGGSYKDVAATLDALTAFFGTLTAQLPGLPAAFLDRAAELRTAVHEELRSEERTETLQEDATSDATRAGAVLRAIGEEYLAMRAVAEHNVGPLPGGDQEVLRQWAHTRPGAVAARKAAVVGVPPLPSPRHDA